ncbi:hypothetical protein F5B20DRAFT_510985 [Whalleya microplaca]|nr:hypothetical protein F5B20DRAFT_510985 [Whalleya microplaca]
MMDLGGNYATLSADAMLSYTMGFVDMSHNITERCPLVMILTNLSWWTSYTGRSNTPASTSPLVLARYSSSARTRPDS